MKAKDVQAINARIFRVQKFGRLLSAIIMPNIGAFITWGLLSALFLPHGWWPNEALAQIVTTMSIYLLPILIGYTGGKVVYGHRGGVLGAITTIGMTVGTTIPMFLGAMLVGPFAAWLIKKFDQVVTSKVPNGFEMLVNNFSAGILGCILAVLAFVGISPVVVFLVQYLTGMVDHIVDLGALPLVSLVIEPAKILFLNNAINHGVLGPIAMEQAVQSGRSILFLLEVNPGPGLGILMAYWLCTKNKIKHSAPGAIIIHFFGGIHEIYFPYILMQPKLVLALIAGGASGILVFSMLGAGLVAVPSPGSIFAIMAMAPKDGLLAVLSGVIVSCVVSFAIAMMLINRNIEDNIDELSHAKEALAQIKESNPLIGHNTLPRGLGSLQRIKTIAIACDAGMGSSVMGASRLRSILTKSGVNITVISCAIDELDSSVDLVITHESLSHRAHLICPEVFHISITDFINTELYQQLADQLSTENIKRDTQPNIEKTEQPETLSKKNIKLGLPTMSKEEAIAQAGKLLCEGAYVLPNYMDAMQEREKDCSTYMANGVAIPHGTAQARELILHSGMCILQFPEGVDFNGQTAYFVVGIAALEGQHLHLLSRLASVIEDEALMQKLRTTPDQEYVYQCFTSQS